MSSEEPADVPERPAPRRHEDEVAEQMRANLKKRKAQQRARRDDGGEPAAGDASRTPSRFDRRR